jgi:2-keto-3-deoxy-L-rhamnonate aldolase RhmA
MPSRNVVKEAARSGKQIRGLNIAFAAPNAIEMLASQIDFVFLDGEHGSLSPQDLEIACITAERWGLTPIARVPDGSAPTILRFLDRGVLGIMVPHVDSVEQGRAAVRATYFAPLGDRSFGGSRPAYQEIADKPAHLRNCNANTALCLMIESQAGLDVAHELAAIEGVDYLTFGPNDLAQSLGYPGEPDHPEVLRAMAEATRRINAAGNRVSGDFTHAVWINEILLAGARGLFGPR